MRLVKIQEEKESLTANVGIFLNYKRAQQVSDRTMRDYVSYLEEFISKSHDDMTYEVLTQDVLDYLSKIPNTSPARFNHRYQALSAFFNWAIRQDLLPKNPITANGIHKKRDDGNIKPASLEDVKILLKSFDRSTFTGLRNYVITLVMLDTGIRTSELRRLRDSDFDFAAKQITISKLVAKTRKNRIVYLSDNTAKQVQKLIKVKPAGWSEYIFPSREGTELTCNGLAEVFDDQCKKAGVKFTPYQLRHTFATYFAASGGDLFTLQDIMGHADIRMTRRYTELDEANKRRQHNNFSPINAIQSSTRLGRI